MLDKSLPFGEVHGDTNGVKFYQMTDKGRYFNAEGLEVEFKTGKIIEKRAPPPAKKKGAAPVEEVEEEDASEQDDEAPKDIIAKGVNLSAVARGEASNVPVAKVKKAVEEHFGKKPKDLEQAIAIINGEEVE